MTLKETGVNWQKTDDNVNNDSPYKRKLAVCVLGGRGVGTHFIIDQRLDHFLQIHFNMPLL